MRIDVNRLYSDGFSYIIEPWHVISNNMAF